MPIQQPGDFFKPRPTVSLQHLQMDHDRNNIKGQR